ncbi:MAG TPA: pyridoxal phosphate-dependent aminotransferase [Acidobacteriota bacterium]|nr:pyridoxal phosphate-dependent aminotransferase [Acidobacteriota bacterium]
MNPIKVSSRAVNTPPSPIRKLAHLAKKAKKAGIHVYHLNIGQPDIESPAEFYEGLRLFNHKVVAYEQSQGNEDLCCAWSRYINRTLGLNTLPEQFLITVGASEALVFLFMTCCDPGDEVIIFDPTYANYLGFASIAGVKLSPVLSNMDDDFALPGRDAIERRINRSTRAILLCNPNNPTGTVYRKEDLTFLFNLCEEHNLFLIVDETYREFVYDERRPLSVLHLFPNSDRVAVVDSLSKRFSLCGARVGCLLTCNEEVLASSLKIAQARLAAPTIEQFASAYMLDHIPDAFLEGVRKEFLLRRDALYSSIKQIPDIVISQPQGAFYTLVQLPVPDAEDFAAFLLNSFSHKKSTVFISPAAGFYMLNEHGRQKARIAYVLNKHDIEEAIEALAAGLEHYLQQ